MLLLILSYVFLQICDLYLSYQFHIKRIKELKTGQLGGCLSLFHAMPLTDITNQLQTPIVTNQAAASVS